MMIVVWSVLVGLITGLFSGIIWLFSPAEVRVSFRVTFIIAFIVGASIAALVAYNLGDV